MTLREAEELYEKFKAEKTYLEELKETLKSMVLPKGLDPSKIVVDGGKIDDKLLLYVQTMDEKQINERLNYIQIQMKILKKFIDKLQLIKQEFLTFERKIYDLRNDPEYLRNHHKPMPFWKIGTLTGYSKQQVINIYNEAEKKISQNLPK